MLFNIIGAQIEYDYSFESASASSGGSGSSFSMSTIEIILLAVVAVIAIAALVISILNMIKIKKQNASINTLGKNVSIGNQDRDANAGSNTGVVFCKNCGNQYGMGLTVCPYCGTKR